MQLTARIPYLPPAIFASLLLGACGALAEPPQEVQRRYAFTQVHMGAPFEIQLYAASEKTANAAAAAAYARIAELDDILSDYNPQSELSKLSRSAGTGRPVPLSADLWHVVARGQQVAHDTDGAFDITVGPYIRLWRRARRSGEMPSAERLDEARQAVGYRHLVLDEPHRTAKLVRPGMRLDLGGIAMGYAIDEAMAVLARHGITQVLIDASGDVRVGEPPPGARGWKIGVAPLDSADGPPSRYLLLSSAAVTMSGDAFQHVVIGGRRYSHIVDPRTGLGLTHGSGVTVIALDGITADSLATAVSVLGTERGMALIERTAGAAAIIVRKSNDRIETFASQRFDDYAKTTEGQLNGR